MSQQRKAHLTQQQRLARYVQGFPDSWLEYPGQSAKDSCLICHVDSDWAGDVQQRKSTMDMII
eukprot:3478359-Prorocentrum_lima.AAC.1